LRVLQPTDRRCRTRSPRAGLWLFLCLLVLTGLPACHKKKRLSRVEESQVRTPADWVRNEAVRDLVDYVRIDTSVSHGEEEGARFLKRLFDCAGIESEIVCPAPQRCNLLARLPGRRREGALLLVNHIDVAPITGPWKEAPPFEGLIKLGYLYGRGSYDMKSTALAQALALRSLKQNGIVPSHDILFLAEADEETDQKWGSRWLLEHRPEWFAGVANVLNEGGTTEMILREVRFLGLETVAAGYGFAELESDDSGALTKLAAHWPALSSPSVEPHPDVRQAFDVIANEMPVPLTDYLRHLDRVRLNPKELAVLPDRFGSFLQPRVQWLGPYRDPTGSSRLYRSYLVIAVPPGVAPAPFIQPIVEEASASGKNIRVVREFESGAMTASPYPTSFTRLVQEVLEARYPGVPFAPLPTYGGFNTSLFFRARGFPTYGFMPVAANVTDASRRHGNEERVFLLDYLAGVETCRDLLEAFAFTEQ
jgi:acetylornithine deacetylase/succinyl-diaminopimelate desuccinylase-like protein